MAIIDELNETLRILEDEITATQKSLLELERKHEIIREALSIYKSDTNTSKDKAPRSLIMFLDKDEDKGKYYDSTLREGVVDILNSQPEKYLTAREIYETLVEGGKKSSSKNFLQNIHIYLGKLVKKGVLKTIKDDNRKRYQLVRGRV